MVLEVITAADDETYAVVEGGIALPRGVRLAVRRLWVEVGVLGRLGPGLVGHERLDRDGDGEDALAAEAKLTAKVAAVQEETRRNETRVAEATRRKEASAAERVRAELAVQRARGAAVKAAEAISLPPALKW